jgi:murein DD-endopeptidase MepM/ murein hydrolase activator NlpD
MADSKSEEQIALELENLEIPGNQNPWQKKDTRYTNSILEEAAATEFSSQALSNIVRRDQNILEGVQNRTSMIIAVQDQLTDYEKVKFNMNVGEDNPGNVNNLRKMYTRNAESKNYFIKPPWKYDDSTTGAYKKFISAELHTTTIRSLGKEGDEEAPNPGDFMEVLYEDQTQNTAKFLRKKKKGLEAFPEFFSTQSSWSSADAWPGNDNSIITKPDAPKKDGPSKLPSPKEWEGKPKEDSIVEQIKKFWSPIFAPIASLPNERIRCSSRFGPRKLKNENQQDWHKGVDLNIDKNNRGAGNPIVAIADGEVTRVGFDGRGNPPQDQQPTLSSEVGYVVVKHTLPKDKASIYEVSTRSMHLFLIGEKTGGGRLVKGDIVKAGDVLGYMGGRPRDPGAGKGSTGTHLHFEVLVSKIVDGIKRFDSYSLNSQSKGGVQGSGGEKVSFAGESTVGAKGAVNPLFFSYPNQLYYSTEAEAGILEQLPQKRQTVPAEEIAEEAENTTTEASEATEEQDEINAIDPSAGETTTTETGQP